jgi:hypothetical protein
VESREPGEVVHNRMSNIPAPRPSKKFGLQIWSMPICSLADGGLRASRAEGSLWLEVVGGGPGVGALHWEGSEYFYLWNSLQGS